MFHMGGLVAEQVAALAMCLLVGLGIPAYLGSMVLVWRKTVRRAMCSAGHVAVSSYPSTPPPKKKEE